MLAIYAKFSLKLVALIIRDRRHERRKRDWDARSAARIWRHFSAAQALAFAFGLESVATFAADGHVSGIHFDVGCDIKTHFPYAQLVGAGATAADVVAGGEVTDVGTTGCCGCPTSAFMPAAMAACPGVVGWKSFESTSGRPPDDPKSSLGLMISE